MPAVTESAVEALLAAWLAWAWGGLPRGPEAQPTNGLSLANNGDAQAGTGLGWLDGLRWRTLALENDEKKVKSMCFCIKSGPK